uniref:Uncharacterized protein n=1 Tax=Eubacterium cellulosolvens (strain ATCC 43171 / JCM 9499 / 6) TaxID=633697 RepID=I5ARA4_EUBC6
MYIPIRLPFILEFIRKRTHIPATFEQPVIRVLPGVFYCAVGNGHRKFEIK